MVPYLFDNMKEVFSGGYAYSYGECKQDANNGFAMFHGGDVQNVEGTPSNEETPDYQKLVNQYDKLSVPKESADWSDKKQCQYTPPNPDFKKDEWFSTCESTF